MRGMSHFAAPGAPLWARGDTAEDHSAALTKDGRQAAYCAVELDIRPCCS